MSQIVVDQKLWDFFCEEKKIVKNYCPSVALNVVKCTMLKETNAWGGWVWVDSGAGARVRSAKQGETRSLLQVRGRVQMAVALLVFWALEYFTNVNLRCFVEADQRAGWVGAGLRRCGRTGEVCEAGRGRAVASCGRTGKKDHSEPLKRCPSNGYGVDIVNVNNLQHILMMVAIT